MVLGAVGWALLAAMALLAAVLRSGPQTRSRSYPRGVASGERWHGVVRRALRRLSTRGRGLLPLGRLYAARNITWDGPDI
jgi:hypothetical protein